MQFFLFFKSKKKQGFTVVNLKCNVGDCFLKEEFWAKMSITILFTVFAFFGRFVQPLELRAGAYEDFVIGITDSVPVADCKSILTNLEVGFSTIDIELISFPFTVENFQLTCRKRKTFENFRNLLL